MIGRIHKKLKTSFLCMDFLPTVLVGPSHRQTAAEGSPGHFGAEPMRRRCRKRLRRRNRVLAAQQGPTVGHSFSGMIVTEAGVDFKVSAVVYVAARAPDAGEDYTELAKEFPTPPGSAGIIGPIDWDDSTRKPSCATSPTTFPWRKFPHYAVQAPFNRILLAGETTHVAWRSKPSWYAVSTEDRTINPDLEGFMTSAAGDETIEVKASHVISQPDTITDLILQAAGTNWGFRSSNHISNCPVEPLGPGVDDGLPIDEIDGGHDAVLEFSRLDATRMWRRTERTSLEKKSAMRLSQEPWVA